jgi:hypothetical protein
MPVSSYQPSQDRWLMRIYLSLQPLSYLPEAVTQDRDQERTLKKKISPNVLMQKEKEKNLQ